MAVAFSSTNSAHIEPISLELTLPWYRSEEQEQRFKRMLIIFLSLMLLLLLVLTFSPVVEREKVEEDKIVAKTKVILKPVTIKPIEPDPPKPKPKPKPKTEAPKVAKTEARSTKPSEKKADVTSHGLSNISSQLSALRNSFDLTKNQKKNVTDSSAGKVQKNTRSLLGKDSATKKSDGIQVDNDIMLDERTTLAAHSGAKVEGLDQGGVTGGKAVSRYSSQVTGKRTMESVRRTLEAKKGAVYALYYQTLNAQPELSGKFIFELVIQPSGEISALKLVSSELGDHSLEKGILDRIRQIRFSKEDVEVTRVNYTFFFLPN